MKNNSSGFTLVELLVVVAIIAVIGAGVSVTYQRLDEKAKTAMEISDISTLKKTIKHWSALNDNALPNEMDSLVSTEGGMYTGINYPAKSTFEIADAPDVVIENLAQAGMESAYLHIADSTHANDSTFEDLNDVDVNTTNTLVSFETDALSTTTRESYDAIIAAVWDPSVNGSGGELISLIAGGETFTAESDLTNRQTAVSALLAAKTIKQMAFIYPGGGMRMMNYTDVIITNCGLKPSEVADPATGLNADGDPASYYLVAMGLGRFSSIYGGKSIRVDAPAYGKRSEQRTGVYNRYYAVIRVPTTEYSSMTGAGIMAQVVDILSPQAHSAASLRDFAINEDNIIKD